jgi:FMN-dependent NADH-azoreductase
MSAHARLSQLDESITKIVQKYQKMKGKTKAEKRDLAQKDIDELRSLIKDSLHDLKESRAKEPDEKRRSKETAAASAPVKPLEEIDLISLPVWAHIALHKRQRAEASK